MHSIDPHDLSNDATANVEFERELSDLVLRAFASGSPVDGDWTVETGSPSVPNWTVQIRRYPPEHMAEDD